MTYTLLVLENFEGKCKRKKIEEKKKKKRKWKIIKNSFKVNNFYMLTQTHLTYFNYFIKILNNLKILKFLTNYNYF